MINKLTYKEFLELPYEERQKLQICSKCIHKDVCTAPERPECENFINEQDYRKLPKDSVVLTKKELDELYNDKLTSMYKDAYDTAYDSLRADLEKGKAIVLSENSVVLSREEYDTLKAENDKYIKDCINYLATINKLENKVWEVEQQSRKETAEKIAKYLFSICILEDIPHCMEKYFKKQFGVEIME